MAEKIILSADLYDNALTEKEGDLIAKPRITGTLYNQDIANRVVEKRTEYRLETIVNILDLADGEKVEAIAEGKSLVDGVGQYLLNINGSFEGEKPTFNPQIHKTGITYTPSKLLLEKLKLISFDVGKATTGPVINTIIDSTTHKQNEVLTAGAPAIISGNTLLLKGDDPSVGVYFTPEGGGEAQKVNLIVSNTKSQIIVSIPQLSDGKYTLSVTTQFAAGYTTVKEPRTYKFPILLTVGEGGNDRPDEV